MMDRTGIFAGDDPFAIAHSWLAEAEASEINDPNAIALATVDGDGLAECAHGVAERDRGARPLCFTPITASAKGREIGGHGQGGLCDALEIAAPSDPGARAGQRAKKARRRMPITRRAA